MGAPIASAASSFHYSGLPQMNSGRRPGCILSGVLNRLTDVLGLLTQGHHRILHPPLRVVHLLRHRPPLPEVLQQPRQGRQPRQPQCPRREKPGHRQPDRDGRRHDDGAEEQKQRGGDDEADEGPGEGKAGEA
ncbi:unnamed protein product [Cuscuta europaea]|uniref:Uncharacterized protein n=1 Tax=Cuscuta europaea TaxID=41803 RepID=A0A9P0ZV73_CUSEU|nr:unnamed protein product [Cuscuta europaea]